MLLDIPDGSIELPMAAFSTQSVPKTLPHYWLTQKDAGIALPPPVPLDMPDLNLNKKVKSITSHQQLAS